MIIFMKVLGLLIAGHFAADYCFQPGDVAKEKSFKSQSDLQKLVPWYYWMASHCAVHALIVFFITQSYLLLAAEFTAHFIIDYAKCAGISDIHEDQLSHVLCKLSWAMVLCFLLL